MDLLLIRHGQVDERHRGLFYGGTEVDLSEFGQAQARLAADFVAELPIRAIWNSPLSRAQFGADCVHQALRERGIRQLEPPQVVPELREIARGRWVGKSKSEVLGEFPGDWEAHCADLAAWRGHGGESLGDLQDRVGRAWQQFQAMDGTHVVVSHLFVTRCLIGLALGLPMRDWLQLELGTGSVSALRRGAAGWECSFVGYQPDGSEFSQAFPQGFPQDNPQLGS